MKIIADENMPLVTGLFGAHGELIKVPGRQMTHDQLDGADALLVRSVTRVDAGLLADSPVTFVGTATIGVDHIDKPYLESRGIDFASAPGCNADSVVNYVCSVLASMGELDDVANKRVGIIGCGNVGGRVYRVLSQLGAECRCYDPFLNDVQREDLCSLEQVLACDIVTMHTPYTTTGPWPTHHMISTAELEQLSANALLINAGRGGAIDGQALKQHLRNGQPLRVVLDVWENEPLIDVALLSMVDIATPHIAGYSLQGKQNGTLMIYREFCEHFGLKPQAWKSPEAHGVLACDGVSDAVLAAYNVMDDDRRMRAAISELEPEQQRAQAFDLLRKHYPVRQEFSRFIVDGELSVDCKRQLKILGFLF